MLLVASSTWKWGLYVMPYDFYYSTENLNLSIGAAVVTVRSICALHVCVCMSYLLSFYFISFHFFSLFLVMLNEMVCVKMNDNLYVIEMCPKQQDVCNSLTIWCICCHLRLCEFNDFSTIGNSYHWKFRKWNGKFARTIFFFSRRHKRMSIKW